MFSISLRFSWSVSAPRPCHRSKTSQPLTFSVAVAGAVRVREGRQAEDQTENHCLRAHSVHVDIWLWSDLLSHCRWSTMLCPLWIYWGNDIYTHTRQEHSGSSRKEMPSLLLGTRLQVLQRNLLVSNMAFIMCLHSELVGYFIFMYFFI